jgi:hypothetical protein
MKTFQARIAGLAIVALFSTATILTDSKATAAVVPGVTTGDVSSHHEFPPSFLHQAVSTIDGSGGVPAGSMTGDHNAAAGDMWLNISYEGSRTCCPFFDPNRDGTFNPGEFDPQLVYVFDDRLAHIVFDLGAVENIQVFRVWNFNQNSAG